MKNLLSSIAIVLFVCRALAGEQTLLVTVKQAGLSTVKLNGSLVNTGSTLPLAGQEWKLKFQAAEPTSRVTISTAAAAPVAITDLSKEFSIRNNVLTVDGVNTTLSGSITFSLSIGGTPVGSQDFFYRQPEVPPVIPAAVRGAAEESAGPGGNTYKIGSAVIDALTLNSNTDASTNKKILAHYANCAEGAVESTYGTNPFLKDKVHDLVTPPPPPDGAGAHGAALPTSFASLLSSAGGMDVTNLADGLARFIVKRTKEELNLAFFDQFKKEMDKITDLQTLFPETYGTLTIIGDEIYNYESYLQGLRENFNNDLNNLPDNLPSVIKNHPEYFDPRPELAVSLQSGAYFATALRDQVHPGDMIADFPTENFDILDKKNKNWKAGIQTVQLFSEALRDTASAGNEGYWVNSDKLRTLVNDPTALNIFCGLIYQRALSKYSGLVFQVGDQDLVLTDQIKALPVAEITNYVKDVKAYLSECAQKTNKLNQLIKAHDKPVNDSAAVELYASYFHTSLGLLEMSKSVYKLVPGYRAMKVLRDSVKARMEQMKPYFGVAEHTENLVVNLNRRKYVAAASNAVAIIQIVYMPKEGENRQAEIAKLEALRDAGKTSETGKKKIENEINTLSTSSDNVRAILRYASFMAAVVEAKSSKEVADAIETFALPSGSSRIKRETPFNVSLNAYAGFFLGKEDIQNKNVFDPGLLNTYGITAPVGIAASTSCHHWSFSAFVSIIDVGAIAAFRFGNDTAESVPNIQLKNIISPGLFLSIGFPKSPLSLNLGAQMGPSLRGIKQNTIDVSDDKYVRYSASLCVDIPVLNFYTRSKGRKRD